MPDVERPKTNPLYIAFDIDFREELDRFIAMTGRDYKTEITFALREHFLKGPQLLPPYMQEKKAAPSKRSRKRKESNP